MQQKEEEKKNAVFLPLRSENDDYNGIPRNNNEQQLMSYCFSISIHWFSLDEFSLSTSLKLKKQKKKKV